MGTNKTLVVIGSGPGIGRSVAALFASKRHNRVALMARRADQLEVEKRALRDAVGDGVRVETFAVDIVDTAALQEALDKSDELLGQPECVFFNAARVQPSQLLEHNIEEIEYDFKISVSALYTVAQRVVPQLIKLGQSDPSSKPSIIVTSSLLPSSPIPQVFSLSLTKAAQRNLMQSLHQTYASEGVRFGLVIVGGAVSPEHEVWNPANIARGTWEWVAQSSGDGGLDVTFDA